MKKTNRLYPGRKLHFLHPSTSNDAFEWLQRHSRFKVLNKVVPSSGFMGIVIAMLNCKRVNVYEFFPSKRIRGEQGKHNHYFPSSKVDAYGKLLYGSEDYYKSLKHWSTLEKHPIVAEKLMALEMNTGTLERIFHNGTISFKGVPGLECIRGII